jgi:hypothetical protein
MRKNLLCLPETITNEWDVNGEVILAFKIKSETSNPKEQRTVSIVIYTIL